MSPHKLSLCRYQAGTLYPKLHPAPLAECGDAALTTEIKEPAPADAPPVRVAFMIVCHGRSLRQVLRLLRLMYSPEHHFLVHVDSRSNYMYKELEIALKPYPNVQLTEWRLATIWGGANLYEVYMRGIRDLLGKECTNLALPARSHAAAAAAASAHRRVSRRHPPSSRYHLLPYPRPDSAPTRAVVHPPTRSTCLTPRTRIHLHRPSSPPTSRLLTKNAYNGHKTVQILTCAIRDSAGR